MAAHAAMSPSGYYPDSRSNSHAPREYDVYMRDNDVYMRDADVYEDRETFRGERYHSWQESPANGPLPAYPSHDFNPFPDQRYPERWHAPAPRSGERDYYGGGDPPEFAPVYDYREEYGRERDFASVDRGRDEYGYEYGEARGYSESYRTNSVPRHDGPPSYDRREDVNDYGGHARTRVDEVRHPSPTLSRTQRSRPARQNRNPRVSDFLAQPGNPNGMPIGKRGANSMNDTRGLANIPPARFDAGHIDIKIEDVDMHQPDFAATKPAPLSDMHRNDIHGMLAFPPESIARVERPFDRQNSIAATKPAPLSEIPPNIHPSRRAIMSRDPPAEGGGGRQIANMRAPRKQLDPVAQSIEQFEKQTPAFSPAASNANAVPLGPGKKMRF